ncbi:hypothetical protein C8R45DRAFT_1073817 [Mycena sanguinolenta]|nr:hypothetical protein C8R45DRAFT_1073817 [Mycena sanguinolenta]
MKSSRSDKRGHKIPRLFHSNSNDETRGIGLNDSANGSKPLEPTAFIENLPEEYNTVQCRMGIPDCNDGPSSASTNTVFQRASSGDSALSNDCARAVRVETNRELDTAAAEAAAEDGFASKTADTGCQPVSGCDLLAAVFLWLSRSRGRRTRRISERCTRGEWRRERSWLRIQRGSVGTKRRKWSCARYVVREASAGPETRSCRTDPTGVDGKEEMDWGALFTFILPYLGPSTPHRIAPYPPTCPSASGSIYHMVAYYNLVVHRPVTDGGTLEGGHD